MSFREESCPKGGRHELKLEKTEEFPVGGKRIFVCLKCGKHFEERF